MFKSHESKKKNLKKPQNQKITKQNPSKQKKFKKKSGEKRNFTNLNAGKMGKKLIKLPRLNSEIFPIAQVCQGWEHHGMQQHIPHYPSSELKEINMIHFL